MGFLEGKAAGEPMVTLADVARRAGVSTATASRVINDAPYTVSEELRLRVLAAVEDLHYVPNAHAQMLAQSSRATVGVIVHDVSDPYFAELTRGLQQVATEAGRLLIICNSYRDPDRELAYIELLRAHQAAAVILAGSGYRSTAVTEAIGANLSAFARAGGQVAVIGRHELPGHRHGLPGHAVLPQNEQGGMAIARAVLDLGHVEIGVVSGPRELTTTADRLKGIRRAFRARRRTLPAQRITYGDFTADGGAAAAAELLNRDPGLTAILALNDEMAVGTLLTLRERRIEVPARMSVAGFDDTPIAAQVTPSLTTVRLPMREMGALAMRLALGAQAAPQVETVPVRLTHRASTAPPPTPH